MKLLTPAPQPDASRVPWISRLLDPFVGTANLWLEQKRVDTQTRLLECRRRLEEARWKRDEAEWTARMRIARAHLEARELESELELLETLQRLPPEQARALLAQDVSLERLRAERAHLRYLRINSPVQPLAPPAPSLPPAEEPAGLERHVSDQMIELMAGRAVKYLLGLAPSAADRAWQEWSRELRKRLPAYAALDIERRAAEMRAVLR